jgi:LCP family protein required for cell wall assembly
MSEWPEGWFRDGKPSSAEPGAADKTVSIPAGKRGAAGPAQDPEVTNPGGQHAVRQYGSPGQPAAAGAATAPPGTWPEQPSPRSRPGGRGAGTPPGPGGEGWRRWLRPRRVVRILAVLVALVVVATIGFYFYLNSQLHRQDVLASYSGRPAVGAGTNWLITGSDSRQGLTRKQERQLSTGVDIGGQRSDTIMVLHIPSGGGRPLLISIPRDSYVAIPGNGYNKINAAFSIGGPKLLAETVQNDTGLYINHYMGIGFGGFVHVVDDIGGVRMCLKAALHDQASGLNLTRGCHNLDGAQALAYVRDRHDFATQDLQREQDQRIFLSALLKKMTSAGTILNPFAAIPAATGTASTLTVDDGTSLYQLIGVARALRNPLTTTVPIATANDVTPAGDSVLWSSQAKVLFSDLQAGRPLPKSLITGSQQGT